MRKKSRLERFFSFNQHRKRFGAKKVTSQLQTVDFEKLKNTIIQGQTVGYTHGSSKDLATHFADLKQEFTNQSELLYYHAKLIVLIRREYKTSEYFSQFDYLWQTEYEFLLNTLNTRWLVSAADTFADHATDSLTKALGLTTSLLINTIKLTETERYLQNSDQYSDNSIKLNELKNRRIDLFDGTSAFSVGTDDTLRNMRWRLDQVDNTNIAGKILKEVFNRIQNNETVYKRMRERHIREKTKWWS